MATLAGDGSGQRLPLGSDDNRAPTGQATADSPFFTKLLPELREVILQEAFGGRKVHMHRYPLPPEPGVLAEGKRYFGCVCHTWNDDTENGFGPADDSCLDYRKYGCEYVKGEGSHNCAIGAIGWLLSCRLAFIEGIKVIYATNTIQIRGGTVEMGITYHVPAQHLPTVRSLEWIIDPRFPELGQSPSAQGQQESLQRLLCAIPKVLPNLQRLYIGFLGQLCFWSTYPETPKERFLIYTEHILPWLDRLAYGFGNNLKDMEVGLPTSVFQAHFHQGLAQGVKFQVPNLPPGKFAQGSHYPRRRIWRQIKQSQDHRGTEIATDRGYWLGETNDDMPDSWMLAMPRFWE